MVLDSGLLFWATLNLATVLDASN